MPESRRLIKSRSGCQQCKRRRVKCDENTPACQQCCRQKLKCPGYQKPLKWVDAQEVPKLAIHYTSREHHLSISKLSSVQESKPLPQNIPSFTQDLALRQPLVEESSGLIHHYFTRVCKIAGCFDSDLNPFRIVPAAMMSYSKPVFLLLQASSAVHLSRQHPRMRLKALSLQSEAFSAVRDDIGKLHSLTDSIVSDELMLTSIIAGLTSAWYDVNDLGLSHVLGSQVLLRLWLMSQKGRLEYQQTFILGAFVYWLMISAFVAGDPRDSFEYQQALQETIRNLEMSHDIVDDINIPRTLQNFIPHPLTGFSTELLIVIGKVGSLCRMHQNGEKQEYLEEKARVIESELFDLVQLHQANFKDPQDPETTIQDILRVGEAYRCAGLLQLYTTFPQLLQQQTQQTSSNAAGTAATNLSLEMEAMILNAAGEFTPAQHNWLRALAFHIFKILETVPATSGTRVLQGLVVLIAATWLVDPVNSFESEPKSDDNHIQPILNHLKLPLKPSSASKEHWRNIVRCGLRMHGEYVGLKQVSRVLEIVEEVWRLDDSKGRACDWMVVVASKGLQTLYG